VAGRSSGSDAAERLSAAAFGHSATRGRLAVLAAARSTLPVGVWVALSVTPAATDHTRVALLLTAQIAFGFAALALSAGRRAEIAAAAAWISIVADLVVAGTLVWLTGGLAGPLTFLLGLEILAVGVIFSAATGMRVLGAAAVVAGVVEVMRPSGDAGLAAAVGIFAVAVAGTGLAALMQREARRRALELATIRGIALGIQESLSLSDILGELCRGVVEHLRFTTAVVLLKERDGELACAGAHGLRGARSASVAIRGGIRDALETGRVVIVGGDQARSGGELTSLLGARGYIAVPMGEEGLLVVTRVAGGSQLRRRAGRVRVHEIEPLISLAQQAALAVANARLHEHMSAMAVTDPLTGLANHGEFQRALAFECERHDRYSSLRAEGHHLSVLLLDIDHFKSVNDRFGHPTGDEVLKAVAAAIQTAVRSFDIVARYGGEEFAVVLPETDVEGAMRVAERAREAVATLQFAFGGRPARVTVSIGVATAPEAGVTPTQLVTSADAALYRSKAAGRDRVTHANAGSRIRSIAHRRAARSA